MLLCGKHSCAGPHANGKCAALPRAWLEVPRQAGPACISVVSVTAPPHERAGPALPANGHSAASAAARTTRTFRQSTPSCRAVRQATLR